MTFKVNAHTADPIANPSEAEREAIGILQGAVSFLTRHFHYTPSQLMRLVSDALYNSEVSHASTKPNSTSR